MSDFQNGRVLCFVVPFALWIACAPPTPTPALQDGVPGVQHVVVIGVDGMSPDGVQKAETPHLDRLMQRGAYSFQARGVMPTSSSSNWASMMMGAGPEQHGVTSNQWAPDKFEIAPTVVGSGGIFPTIFGVLREQRPSAILACFHDWDAFARLLEPDAPDIIQHGDGPINTTEKAIDYFKSKRPNFTFIHLDHVDHAGHTYGHGSTEYYLSVQEADRLVGEIVRGLEEAEILNQSILLVSADHGGVGTKHGNATTAEIEIPWIIAGPGIVSGRKLTSPINTYDTAATVAYILGVKPPHAWIGRPVLEAFR